MTLIKSYHFDSHQHGPHLLLLGAIHGNEIAGPTILLPLIQKLMSKEIILKKGKVTIAPICNPQAYKMDTRYIEVNLNRVIKEAPAPRYYEEQLAQDIIKLIDDCDYMLDIHSTHMEGDPAFTFMNQSISGTNDFAMALGVQTLFVGWEDVYDGEDFSTESYAGEHGKIGITLECGYHKSDDTIHIAGMATLNAMKYLGIIETPINCDSTNHTISTYRFTEKVIFQNGYKFVKNWKHMDPIDKGTIIFTDHTGNDVVANDNGYILIPNPDAQSGMEFYYFGVKDLQTTEKVILQNHPK